MPGGGSGMNAAVIFHLPLTVPGLALVLQGAALGALVGSVVLCRARVRGMRLEAWAVTAAWSTLGAGIGLVYVLVCVLV